MKASLFILMQYVLPQQLLSRLAGKLANCKISFIKNSFISWFVKRYNVDMSEALQPDTTAYADFNSFFTRALKAGARPIDNNPATLACPADGAISQLGTIEHKRIFQAKGRSYSVQALLGGDAELADEFTGGSFATVYLSPRDYHRVHMPMDGTLRSMIYVPGKLFSVNTITSEHVDALFARNERVVCIFDTDAGPMALVLVGAMIVAGVETVWAGHVCPDSHTVVSTDYQDRAQIIRLSKGEEMGRFKLGSTVVAVFGPDMIKLNPALAASTPVRMGQPMATMNTPNTLS
jgi:phosphatidylserine decarboxylase